MQKNVRKWLDLIRFMGRPEDTSEGHLRHDYREEFPEEVNPRLVGAIKTLLGVGVTILVVWLLIKLLT